MNCSILGTGRASQANAALRAIVVLDGAVEVVGVVAEDSGLKLNGNDAESVPNPATGGAAGAHGQEPVRLDAAFKRAACVPSGVRRRDLLGTSGLFVGLGIPLPLLGRTPARAPFRGAFGSGLAGSGHAGRTMGFQVETAEYAGAPK